MILSFSCNKEEGNLQKAVKDGVFIHISHGPEDMHRVLMGLQMASIMSEDRDVLVYFDIKGIEVVLKDAEDLNFSHFPSSKTQIDFLLSKNVTLLACPGCLKASGKTELDLKEGIKVAEKEKFFNFTSGRILTLDY
jgi:predicted peroxiredoxin